MNKIKVSLFTKMNSKISLLLIPFFLNVSISQTCDFKSFKKGRKYGYVDQNGKKIIKPIYDFASDFYNNYGVFEIYKNGKTTAGLINCKGEFVLPPIYENISQNKFNKYLVARKDGYEGVIDTNGKTIIDFKYSSISTIYDIFKARINVMSEQVDVYNSKFEFIDSYDELIKFEDNVFMTRVGNSFGLLNFDGTLLLPPIHEYVGHVYFPTLINNSWKVKLFINEKIEFKLHGKAGIMRRDGEILVDPLSGMGYELISHEHKGRIRVSKEGKYGFLDKKMNIIIPLNYEWADNFYEGVAAVKKNGKVGFIDTLGKVIIPFKYDKGFSHMGGWASVTLNGESFIIDLEGNRYIPPKIEASSSPSKPNCLQTCYDCFGFGDRGKRDQVSTKSRCNACNGSGASGYEKSELIGYTKKYTYSTKSSCQKCNGTGSMNMYTTQDCPTCKGSGCLRYEK